MPFFKSLFLLLCLTFLFAACSEVEDAVNQTCASNPSTLIEAETLWACQAVSSYEMDLTVSCNCMNYLPYHIVVGNNEVISIEVTYTSDEDQRYIEEMEAAYGESFWGYEYYSLSIDDLFEEINNRMSQNPASAVIEYDKTYGFPTIASFDMDVMIADEEIGYYLSDFVPL
jgi:hypothetical protein